MRAFASTTSWKIASGERRTSSARSSGEQLERQEKTEQVNAEEEDAAWAA
jgi:hypothetical protein